jgi:CxxC motif-containing protein (DUF1111 family)
MLAAASNVWGGPANRQLRSGALETPQPVNLTGFGAPLAAVAHSPSDGITSGSAGPTMMRTAPLWGIRAKSAFLHEGRAGDLPTAIELDDGQGKAAADAFKALNSQEQQDLINFLDTI